jgi:hypothetical protein
LAALAIYFNVHSLLVSVFFFPDCLVRFSLGEMYVPILGLFHFYFPSLSYLCGKAFSRLAADIILEIAPSRPYLLSGGRVIFDGIDKSCSLIDLSHETQISGNIY